MLWDKDIKKIEEIQTDFNPEHFDLEKDVFYRMKNHEHLCRRRILLHTGIKFIQITSSNSVSTELEKPYYLIFDDRTVEKI
jgi:hypothetical protein